MSHPLLFGETIYFRTSYVTIINQTINKRRKIYICVCTAGILKAFYFHSFLIDMFFSLSFCITFATAISKSSWVT